MINFYCTVCWPLWSIPIYFTYWLPSWWRVDATAVMTDSQLHFETKECKSYLKVQSRDLNRPQWYCRGIIALNQSKTPCRQFTLFLIPFGLTDCSAPQYISDKTVWWICNMQQYQHTESILHFSCLALEEWRRDKLNRKLLGATGSQDSLQAFFPHSLLLIIS